MIKVNANASAMVELYDWSIDQWLEDTPLTKHQQMFIKYSGNTLEEELRSDLERRQHWINIRNKEKESEQSESTNQ